MACQYSPTPDDISLIPLPSPGGKEFQYIDPLQESLLRYGLANTTIRDCMKSALRDTPLHHLAHLVLSATTISHNELENENLFRSIVSKFFIS
jgi:hypothetical protein